MHITLRTPADDPDALLTALTRAAVSGAHLILHDPHGQSVAIAATNASLPVAGHVERVEPGQPLMDALMRCARVAGTLVVGCSCCDEDAVIRVSLALAGEQVCPVCEESDCEAPDEGPSAYCTRPGCYAAHDEHATDTADHCGTFTLVVDPVDEE
ncbi:hypothetical protein [Streptomyces sp. NBRC 109706]|uniref:hypothetical protein n=1 Tax=Streptomyces sp. NBRC 109706 TaxID=1550035 RepID=UPI0007849D2C|nr:hypothetical protein [Streptomyces sp. NBRC 109706]